MLKLPLSPQAKELSKKFAEQITGRQIKDTEIKGIKVHTFSNRIKRIIDSDIKVGQELDSNLANIPHEPVLAIFESDQYLVVTPNKNDSKGTIYFFDPREVVDIKK